MHFFIPRAGLQLMPCLRSSWLMFHCREHLGTSPELVGVSPAALDVWMRDAGSGAAQPSLATESAPPSWCALPAGEMPPELLISPQDEKALEDMLQSYKMEIGEVKGAGWLYCSFLRNSMAILKGETNQSGSTPSR